MSSRLMSMDILFGLALGSAPASAPSNLGELDAPPPPETD
eukprot:CAMPEP_0179001614 /NCGR_PEP_ID=MMETSP0795-20121207/11477_1 /TAXON_ID=88552 /ORGANISM="Amoebophrya sp., Strain Ameob2" /LENGTH=39 /DNA_ID= /DNA_START= /DNA_END= /DNA_ORIENTATION=